MKRQRCSSNPSLCPAPTLTYNSRSRQISSIPVGLRGRSGSLSVLVSKEEKALECVETTFEEVADEVEKIEEIYADTRSVPDVCYVLDTVCYVKLLEERRKLPKRFLAGKKPVVTTTTRAVIMDWLIQVQHHLNLLQETLYLSVNIIDHYFARKAIISTPYVQLIVIGAVFISCKVEERSAPTISKLIHLTQDSYEYAEVIDVEKRILRTLDFNLNFASPVPFLCHCVQVCRGDETISILSYYLVDVILHDVRSTRFYPSILAASAVYLARKIVLKEKDCLEKWNRTLRYYSGYEEVALQPVVTLMCETLVGLPTSRFKGALNKYSSVSRYRALSKWPELAPDSIESLKLYNGCNNNDDNVFVEKQQQS